MNIESYITLLLLLLLLLSSAVAAERINDCASSAVHRTQLNTLMYNNNNIRLALSVIFSG